MKYFKKNKLLIILIVVAVLLRFYNLNWGAPFYFHPDERNIAHSVSQISFPDQMNPNFFAYGSLPIYIIYFTGVIKNLLFNFQNIPSVSFSDAIIISRFYSAFFSVALIPLLYLIGKKIKDEKIGLLAAFLATFSVGLIQFAHFGTFEMWLTFFSLFLFLLTLNYLNKPQGITAVLIGLVFGVLISTKISSLALLPLPVFVIFMWLLSQDKAKGKDLLKDLLLFIVFSCLIYIISNPFAFLDHDSFQNSMTYESSLAIGTLPVFYTGGFYNTVPIIYQFTKVYPFLINPILTFIFVPSLIYFLIHNLKTKNLKYLMLNTFFLLLFISQSTLFVKWTRYMMPTLPFMYLIIAITIQEITKNILIKKHFSNLYIYKKLQILILTIIFLTSIIFSLSYFITAFVKPDTRIEALKFSKINIPKNAKIITEPYDLGITPFSPEFENITIFNFYELDRISFEFSNKSLLTTLSDTNYIILPSQRISKNRLLHKDNFPKGHMFYSDLLNGSIRYQEIYQTPCDIFCKITYLGDPMFSYEETASVFDRPTIMIFEKK